VPAALAVQRLLDVARGGGIPDLVLGPAEVVIRPVVGPGVALAADRHVPRVLARQHAPLLVHPHD
jgi:hypothetical protein